MEHAALLSTHTGHGKSVQTNQAMQTCAAQIPLSMAGTGVEVSVVSIRGKDDTKRFLRNLGFVEGASATVVSEMNGNVIVNVKGTRVAVSRSMANRILTAC